MTAHQITSAPAIAAASTGVDLDGVLPAELTRGNEQQFLEQLAPRVRRQDVELDLSAVERIDAAGMSALIKLYCDACNSGHRFSITRPRRHVREILSIVGLDRLLLDAEEAVAAPMQRSAA